MVGLVAFDQAMRRERWCSGPIGVMANGLPMLVKRAGVDSWVVGNILGVSSVAAADGKVLWRYAHPECHRPRAAQNVHHGGRKI